MTGVYLRVRAALNLTKAEEERAFRCDPTRHCELEEKETY